eukprot:m.239621 g.239621  ORF g.239621 m.239621 type:complete len:142 (+) comp16069_c2_seq2:292-717(+)
MNINKFGKLCTDVQDESETVESEMASMMKWEFNMTTKQDDPGETTLKTASPVTCACVAKILTSSMRETEEDLDNENGVEKQANEAIPIVCVVGYENGNVVFLDADSGDCLAMDNKTHTDAVYIHTHEYYSLLTCFFVLFFF